MIFLLVAIVEYVMVMSSDLLVNGSGNLNRIHHFVCTFISLGEPKKNHKIINKNQEGDQMVKR